MKTVAGIIAGVGIGAGCMYFLDPTGGKRRRSLLRDTIVHLSKVFKTGTNVATRDTANRVKGVVEEAKRFMHEESVDDAKLLDRVRTAVGRVSSHPNVEVIVEDGIVTLLGPVVNKEKNGVLRAAKSVRGVQGVTNRMKPYQRLVTEQRERSNRRHWFDFMRAHWSPATRIGLGGLGGAAAIAGFSRGGRRGNLIGATGAALAARAVSNVDLERLLGIGSDRYSEAA